MSSLQRLVERTRATTAFELAQSLWRFDTNPTPRSVNLCDVYLSIGGHRVDFHDAFIFVMQV